MSSAAIRPRLSAGTQAHLRENIRETQKPGDVLHKYVRPSPHYAPGLGLNFRGNPMAKCALDYDHRRVDIDQFGFHQCGLNVVFRITTQGSMTDQIM